MKRARQSVIANLESRLLMAVIAVTNTNDSGDGSLSAAISAAAAGDTIDLTSVSGTINNIGSYNISSDLTITGPGVNALTLDGDGFESVFKIIGGNGSISGVTITQENMGEELGLRQGGGIYIAANLTLDQRLRLAELGAVDADRARVELLPRDDRRLMRLRVRAQPGSPAGEELSHPGDVPFHRIGIDD